jgi:hypothetical protein
MSPERIQEMPVQGFHPCGGAREEKHRDRTGLVGAAHERLVRQLQTRNDPPQPVSGLLGADVLVNGGYAPWLP